MPAQEHFFPFFTSRGYDCYAPSYRGQGTSDPAPGAFAKLPISHAEDVAEVVRAIGGAPVIIAHSFAGTIVDRWAGLRRDSTTRFSAPVTTQGGAA